MQNRIQRRTAMALAMLLPALATHAQEPKPWPMAKPITWIVGQPAGGSVDVVTRLVARKFSELSGQAVVVDNRPGASGSIGLQAAAKASADGYTILTASGPNLYAPSVPIVGRELVAAAMIAQGPMVLVAPASTKAANLGELIRDMKKSPGDWSYATSGTGTSQHVAGELFNTMAGTSMVQVPYKGGGQAVTDVLGGQVPLGVLGVAPVVAHIKAGRLKAYAVTTTFRIESLPNVPTMQEAGLKGFDASQWYVVALPKGTPAPVIEKINGWINRIAQMPEVKATLTETGSQPGSGDARSVQHFLDLDRQKWLEVARTAKITLD